VTETITTLAVIGLAFSLDLLIGEPRNQWHPVAWFGRFVAFLDRDWASTDRGQQVVGIAIAGFTPLLPAIVAGGLVYAVGTIQPLAGAVLAGVVLFVSTSLRSLLELTETVLEATEGDLEIAREEIRGLVGRERTGLSSEQLRSAAIESVAENLADGLVASLVAFALFAPVSLPVATAAAVWVKGVNTLDSMLGYPEKPIGTASARLDDFVMWIPARLTALAIAAAAGNPRALWEARTWARVPASPNSGWPMATLACVLSIRLWKVGVYDLNPDADLPTIEDGTRAVTLVGFAAVVSVIFAVVLATASGALVEITSANEAVEVIRP